MCLVSWQFLNSYYGSCRHFFHLEEKFSLKHTLPNNKITSIFYVLTIAELLSLFPGSFALIVVSTGICVFGGGILPKTHIGHSVAFPTTKTPARLCLIFWYLLHSYYGLYRYFFHLEEKWHQILTSGHIYPVQWQKHLGDGPFSCT